MTSVTASELAGALGVTRGRISQYVREGKLEGCYSGQGRGRRFDLEKSAQALDRRLDPGQSLGNGAAAAEARRGLSRDGETPPAADPEPQLPSADPDADRYKRARAEMAEVRAMKERLALAETEGRYVLASEVDLNVRRAIAAELSEVESVLRTAAQKIAAEHSVDGRAVRTILFGVWREHRARRSGAAAEQAGAAQFSEAEQAEGVTV